MAISLCLNFITNNKIRLSFGSIMRSQLHHTQIQLTKSTLPMRTNCIRSNTVPISIVAKKKEYILCYIFSLRATSFISFLPSSIMARATASVLSIATAPFTETSLHKNPKSSIAHSSFVIYLRLLSTQRFPPRQFHPTSALLLP